MIDSIIKNSIFAIIMSFVLVIPSYAMTIDHTFPRTANYFLDWSMTESQALELAQWDVLVLDMEHQVTNPHLLKKIRSRNRDIIILAYITPQEIFDTQIRQYSTMRNRFASGLSDQWYLKNTSGENISLWQNTKMLNISSQSPLVKGQRLNDYVAHFVVDEVLSTGYWDGVFYDNAWNTLTYFVGTDVDIDNDYMRDTDIDDAWRQGMRDLYQKTQAWTDDDIVIVGNAATNEYRDVLNGNMIESFNQTDEWEYRMNIYKKNNNSVSPQPRIDILNANTLNKGNNTDYKTMRYGLTSTLLEDGYYSFDYGNTKHGQTWWYDEYDIDLGDAISESSSQNNHTSYTQDVWQRQFENGISVVNSTLDTQKISLGGEYEKIHGTQDTLTNDGSIVSEVTVPGQDGIVLLKTFDVLYDVLFTNGAFARFFRPDGSRVRNGFFVFDETYTGGNQIAYIDLDGNGKRELIVVKRNKIEIWRDDGIKYMRVFPFTANYKGKLNVAIGDMDENKRYELFVAPSAGFTEPIKIYNRFGFMHSDDFYPFGKDYSGGYSLAVGDVDGELNTELVVGRAGDSTQVYVYDRRFQLKYSWRPFESWFLGGANVSTGDVDGDFIDEIVVGRGKGGKPEIGVFDAQGTLLYNKFDAYQSFGTPGIDVRMLDVDFDGRDDIVGMSDSAF